MVQRVLLASPRGYCAGVERAVETVELALEHYGAPVYVRKQIVHNIHVVRDLEARGAIFVEEETEVPAGATVVYSAHGVAPSVYANSARLGHNVIGVARTRTEAIKIAGEGKRPGLILADIQLADGSSGLDAVNDLLKTFEVPVIFITAYPERFLTGERPEPAFLIAKPFQPANVSAVISQALFFQQTARRREAKTA